MQNAEDLSSAGKPAEPSRPSFDETIADLEEAAGESLTGPGRWRMEAAFENDPEAFECCKRKALRKRNVQSLLGLFVRIVDDEHASNSRRLAAEREARLSRGVARDAGSFFAGNEVWIRNVGVNLEDEDLVRAMLEDQRVGRAAIEQLLELWRELRLTKAA